MRSRSIRVPAAAIALALSLASCQMEMGVGARLKRDGSGSFTLALAADKEFIDGLASNTGTSGRASLGGFETLFDSLGRHGWRVSKTTTPKGDAAYTAACDFRSPRDVDRCLGQLSAADGGAGNVRFKDTGLTFDLGTRRGLFTTHSFFAGSVNLAAAGKERDAKFIEQVQAIASRFFTFTIRAQLPGSPRVTKGGSVASIEGNVVVWRPRVGEKLEFRAESDAYSAAAIGSLAIVMLLLLGAGIWTLVRRSSRRGAEDSGGFVSGPVETPSHATSEVNR